MSLGFSILHLEMAKSKNGISINVYILALMHLSVYISDEIIYLWQYVQCDIKIKKKYFKVI